MIDSFVQSFRMAVKSIAGNKMRAFLTMLGIIIGVMALVILVSLVNGATSSVTGAIAELGTDLITVTVRDDKGSPVTLSELAAWSKADGIGQAAAWKTETATAKHGGNSDSATVYGTTAAYCDVQDLKLMLGRYILSSDVENKTNVCVINETAAEELIGYTDCLGEDISINGVKFTVVGILKDNEDSLTALFTKGMLVAHIPFTSLVRLSKTVSPKISSFYLSAEEGRTVEDADQAITEILMDRLEDDENAFDVDSQNILEDATADITSVLSILLGGIAAISLIVGGIGIMNIMLVTVTERTREIGIRKAIGASRGVILQQFLMESVMLCMFGCAIGIAVSWGILSAIGVVTSSVGLSFDMDGTVVLVAVLFCFAIGVGFGLYPANKAAKMKPIDALHYGG